MKLKKRTIKNGNYDITYYPCNRFSSMDIILNFQVKRSKSTYFDFRTLLNYMTCNTKKYNSLTKYNKREKELYNTWISYSIYPGGDNFFIVLQVNFSNPRLLKDDYFKDAIDFAREAIYNPNFKDGKVNKTIFRRGLKMQKEELKERLTNPDYKAHLFFINSVAPNSYATDNLVGSKKEINELFKNIDVRMYDTYKKLMNSFVSMQLIGDFRDDEIEVIKKAFKFKKVNKLNTDFPPPKDYKNINKVKKDKDISESTYFEAFQIKNYDRDKRYYYELIMSFLNNEVGKLLHMKLRDEMGLVYGSFSSLRLLYGSIVIMSNINGKNKEKCSQGIKEVFDSLKDEKKVKELLDSAIEKYEEIDFLSEENYANYLEYVRLDTLKLNTLYYEFLENVKRVKPKEIIDVINNLERKATYLYEGTKR